MIRKLEDSVPPAPFYEERPGRWAAEPAWPSAHIQTRTLWPGEAGLEERPAPEAEFRFRGSQFAGSEAGIWCPYGDPADLPPDEQERVLLHELENYRPDLLERPRLIVGTKADVVQPDELAASGWRHPVISAVTGQGVRDLVGAMAVVIAVLTVQRRGNVPDIVAPVTIGWKRQFLAAQFQVAQPDRRGKDVHLATGIIHIVLAVHVEACGMQQVGHGRPVGGTAPVPHFQGTGRVW